MRKLALVLLAALAAACREDLTAEEIREALPKKESIYLGTPDDAAPAALAAAAGRAEFADTTFWTAATVNVAVGWTLLGLEWIVAFPASECDVEACTWGPHLAGDERNHWQLVVRRDGDGYAYDLEARPVSRAALGFRPIVSGYAVRGADRWHGAGDFTVDFDAAAGLDHEPGWQQEDFGVLDVSYDNREALRVDAVFRGAENDDPAWPSFVDAAYAFEASQGGGTLEVAFRTLELEPRTLSLRSRWTETGAGRGDVQATADGVSVKRSQCWGAAPGVELVFDSLPSPDFGHENDCAFLDAEYATLPPPAP